MPLTVDRDRLRSLSPGGTLHETHASLVLVDARQAIKIKKPVVLPFLDYGSLARRRDACRAEVELNRRLAPGIYRGVASIVADGDGVALAEEDDPRAVEYAVLMRAYDDADTLAARVASGRAGPGELERIGARLARFHAEAARAEGGAESVMRWLDDDFASLLGLTGGRDRQLVVAAQRFAAAFLGARWEALDDRGRAGRVRDGHGDLRAEHVVLEGDDILVVDCVEFEPALRRIDVSCDLAFLVMDLEGAGRGDLAAALVAGYRGAGGDPGDAALLSFFAAYRAHVRAKVALVRAAQDPGGRAAAVAEAGERLRLAERLVWRARGPVTIAVGGLAASGKTTLATELAGRSGLRLHQADAVRKAQVGVAPGERAPAGAYTPPRSVAVYAELGRTTVAAPHGAVIDATFRAAADREAFARHAGDRRTLHVECVTPAATRIARARARETDPARLSDADAAVAAEQVMEPMDEVAPRDHVIVRGDAPVEEQLAAVADALDRSGGCGRADDQDRARRGAGDAQ